MNHFDQPLDRYHTDVIKWDRLAADFGREGLLPFGIADMDFHTLPSLSQAITQRAQHPTYGYTYASQGYYDSFIRWNRERNNFEVKREEIISIPGIVCAFSFVVYALTAPGDQVLVNTPVYDPFFQVIRQQGRTLVTSSLVREGGRHTINFQELEDKLRGGVKLMVLCSPQNPLGRVWTQEELAQVVELCDRYNVYLFSDEIHSDLIFPGHKHIPIFNASPKARRLAVLAAAPSKTFNVAGLKSSMLVVRDEELRQKVSQPIAAFHVGVNLFGLKAAEVAYREGGQWVDQLVEYLYGNAKTVVSFFQQNLPKVKAYLPEGTYLMWLDFSAYGLTQQQLMDKLVCEAGVALNDGAHYGKEGEGFARLNIGTQRATLMEGLERIRKAFAQE